MVLKLDPEEVETRVIHTLVDFHDKDVLEVGCGEGRMTWRFADKALSVLAIDPDDEKIAKARESVPAGLEDRVSFRVADVIDDDLGDASFDLAVLSWSL